MGRFLLLVVLAAAVGGTTLTLGMRGTLSASDRRHAEGQADVLAREIAEAGNNVALREMVTDAGFVDPTDRLGDAQDYDGGSFRIVYTPGATADDATVRVMGSYGGAVHSTERAYTHDPMDAPGPLWLDVPFATASAAAGAEIAGGAEGKPVHLDRRKHDASHLGDILPLDGLKAALDAVARTAGNALSTPETAAWEGEEGLLGDLNVDDAEGLYRRATEAMDADDLAFTGDQLVSGTANWGRASDGTQITHVDGDLTVAGRVKGHGALVVNGALRVQASGTLDWEGLVVVRSTADVLPIELDGTVSVDGMMVVAHSAFVPGGHLDVSVYRDASGMASAAPWGDVSAAVAPWNRTAVIDGVTYHFPWHQHTHAFDVTPEATPRGDHVYFREAGAAGRHEAETQFHDFVRGLGDTEVYLELANTDRHGQSTFGLDVVGADGTGGRQSGRVEAGFGGFTAPGASHRSKTFAASDLRALDLDVLSLRSLKQAFDDPTCADWPLCIGFDWDREGAMALRLHRASDGARLYEASFYWHMREDEKELHEAEEAAWRARILAGEDFGAHLRFGADVTLTFDLSEIEELADKLSFDGDEVRLVSATSSHLTPAQTASGIPVCHEPAAPARQTKVFADLGEAAGHLSHGDTLGACASEGEGLSKGEAGATPPGRRLGVDDDG